MVEVLRRCASRLWCWCRRRSSRSPFIGRFPTSHAFSGDHRSDPAINSSCSEAVKPTTANQRSRCGQRCRWSIEDAAVYERRVRDLQRQCFCDFVCVLRHRHVSLVVSAATRWCSVVRGRHLPVFVFVFFFLLRRLACRVFVESGGYLGRLSGCW